MADSAISLLVEQYFHLTDAQFRAFLDMCLLKLKRARIEPGTAVGALGAQSK